MILIAHILIALASMAHATYLFVNPSQRGLHISYGLAGMTLSSGTYLVVSSGAELLPACMTGIGYLAIVSAAIMAARQKLASERIRTNR